MAAELKSRITARARELGFDAVGVSRAEPAAHAEFLDEWLARSFGGEMDYMARHPARRKDPRAVMPEARSLILVGLNYHARDERQTSNIQLPTSKGFVARYARGDDYHEVMGHKLESLAAFIREISADARTKTYVDTGALLERELAQQAGVGFVGKSTILINRGLGTWFFLGEILTSLELTPDTPQKNLCGMCVRCIDICPTQAIVAPFQLDSRRCISYLTIELKGAIPRELRPLIGTRIFGCDDCLEVCPWNRFAKMSRESAFQPRTVGRDAVDGVHEHKTSTVTSLDSPDLLALLSLNEEQFHRAFKNSPIKRIKRRGLLRNVCVALGNAGDLRAVPALVRALGDAESLVRGHAAWALGQLGGEEGRRALVEAGKNEQDSFVRQEIQLALSAPR